MMTVPRHPLPGGPKRRRRRLASLGALLASSLILSAAHLAFTARAARAEAVAEDVKAAFVYQFTKFIDWPRESAQRTGPFIVAVAGAPDIFEPFAKILSGRKVGERPVQVVRYQPDDSPDSYDLIFFSGRQTAGIRAKELGSRALTVGDGEGFLERGGMIEFVHQGNRIRFRINATLARSQGFMMSSKLLSLAIEVR